MFRIQSNVINIQINDIIQKLICFAEILIFSTKFGSNCR